MKKKIIVSLVIIFILVGIYLLYLFNVIPHRKYDNKYFNIEEYISNTDKDNDGIPDNIDILNNALAYIKTKPQYKSKYYSNGYPDDEYGVCTDVVAFALLRAGYDIKELLNQDVLANKEYYDIPVIDKNIDFRRVYNIQKYLEKNAITLTTDLKKMEEWQAGDIVVLKRHIGIIANNRNYKGIPFLIHHARVNQLFYEEDILEYSEILGHYRIS